MVCAVLRLLSDLVGRIVGPGVAGSAATGDTDVTVATASVEVMLLVRAIPVATTPATGTANAQHGGDDGEEANRGGSTKRFC
jgi:hypothetical protein